MTAASRFVSLDALNADDTVNLQGDDITHIGLSPLSSVNRSTFSVVGLPCPDGCGTVGFYSIAVTDTAMQALFLRLTLRRGCPCGALPANRPIALVRAHLRQHAQQMGGDFLA